MRLDLKSAQLSPLTVLSIMSYSELLTVKPMAQWNSNNVVSIIYIGEGGEGKREIFDNFDT